MYNNGSEKKRRATTVSKLNKGSVARTYEGAPAFVGSPEFCLRRAVVASMLFEDTFYEEGVAIEKRIERLVPLVKPAEVARLAIDARTKYKIRHTPLLLIVEMLKHPNHKKYVRDVIQKVINRADELADIIALYWRKGKKPLPNQLKKGIAAAFHKFQRYHFEKYARRANVKVRIRDAMFLTHPKPLNNEEKRLFEDIANDKLEPAVTWEVEISKYGNRKEVWEKLLLEDKLGALALLRNLRNMIEAKVDTDLIEEAIRRMKVDKVLPFRFVTAAKYAPQFESVLEAAMLRALSSHERLPGTTALLIDGSGSMKDPLSRNSEATRFETACALAILLREICQKVNIYVFSTHAYRVPSRYGFALRDALKLNAEFGGTRTQDGINLAAQDGYDRLIIITDEQSHTGVHNPIKGSLGYIVNVAPYQYSIGYKEFVHIDGWSEAIVEYIQIYEKDLTNKLR